MAAHQPSEPSTPAQPAAAHAAPAPELPQTREGLLVLHTELRRRRNAAAAGGPEWEAAVAEIGRVEIEIARVERAMDPPLV